MAGRTLIKKQKKGARSHVVAAILLTAMALALWVSVLVYRGSNAPARQHAEKAAQLFEMSDFAGAEREWEKAVELDPDMLEVWQILAKYYKGTKRPELSRNALLQVRRLKPDLPGVNGQLAESSIEMGDERKALEFAEEELKRNPRNEAILKLVARQYESRNEVKYLETRRRLLEIRPDDMEARLVLAEALTWKTQWAESLAHLERVLVNDPKNARALTLRAACLMEDTATSNSMARAESDLLTAVSEDSKSPLIRFILGKLYRRKGDGAQAVKHLELAAVGEPNSIPIQHELSLAYAVAGRPGDASKARKRFAAIRQETDRINALELRSSTDPNNFDLLLEVAQAHQRANNPSRARLYLARAQLLRPDSSEVSKRMGQLATTTPNQIRNAGPQ